MKRILITGAGSYIGTSFKKWVSRWPDEYQVDTIDMRFNEWKGRTFSLYDVIYHVAAIVHVKENDTEKYFSVNRDLAVEVAKKAKVEGVKQFVFLSTMGVYGMETGFIDKYTKPNPKTSYAQSKLEAESLLSELADDNFKVATLRPPMVYGKGCKGNYPRLAKLAIKTPIFPKIDNKRSMIYIDNLSEFVKQLIDNRIGGLFFPQNVEYVNTSEMVRLIAEVHGKKIVMTKLFNPLLRLMNVSTINKLFGDLVYEKELYSYKELEFFAYEATIRMTEN